MMKYIPLLLAILSSLPGLSNSGTWISNTVNLPLPYAIHEAATPKLDLTGKTMTVVYLIRPGFAKLGQNDTATDVEWLLQQGYRVVVLDYNNHPEAKSPGINTDIKLINQQLAAGNFCGLTNCSQTRSYILFDGYRLQRDVAFFKDDPTVYNHPTYYTDGDSLYMDIVYPANPINPAPVILSFSYSNSTYVTKHQRLNLANTLAGFNDTFLEGAPARGFAWAIADHPKYANWGNGKPVGGANDTYKSYQVNPDAAQKVKSAIRTLRFHGQQLGLSAEIGIYGFSRGSDAGAMAIGDRYVEHFSNTGLHPGIDEKVQAAALGPGVFDFTQIYNYLNDGDGNLETRCPWAWGTLQDNYALWESMGAAHLVETNASAPVLFFYNTTDAGYYQDQVAQFRSKLQQKGVATKLIIDYGTGHSVPQSGEALDSMYHFFKLQFTSEDVTTYQMNTVGKENKLSAIKNIFISGEKMHVEYMVATPGKIQFEVTDMAGRIIYSISKTEGQIGISEIAIPFNELNFHTGVCFIRLITGEMQTASKFIL